LQPARPLFRAGCTEDAGVPYPGVGARKLTSRLLGLYPTGVHVACRLCEASDGVVSAGVLIQRRIGAGAGVLAAFGSNAASLPPSDRGAGRLEASRVDELLGISDVD
jgi:hypothetical protein